MKRILLLILLIVMVVDAYSQSSPLVLTQSNFPITAKIDVMGVILEQYNGEVHIPDAAENGFWNYSNFNIIRVDKQEKLHVHLSENTNSFFSDAQFVRDGSFRAVAGDRGFFYNSFIKTDENGFYSIGMSIDEQEYSLADLTHNDGDKITFPKQEYKLDENNYTIKFPMTYGDHFESSYKSIVNFGMNVGMLGLENADVTQISYINQADTVIGWGELVVPNVSDLGNFPSVPYRVLLVKNVETKLDSFMLFGVPAPEAMLGAFSVYQGILTTTIKYQFWREGSQIPLLSIWVHPIGNFVVRVEYDLNTDHSTSVNDENTIKSELLAYPNPVNNTLSLKLDENNFTWSNAQAVIIDMNGKLISDFEITITNANTSIKLPEGITNGTYFINLIDNAGNMISKSKFVVNK